MLTVYRAGHNEVLDEAVSFVIESIAMEKLVRMLDDYMTVTEIQKKTKWKRQLIYGLLRRLRDREMIDQTEGSPKRYRRKGAFLLQEVWR